MPFGRIFASQFASFFAAAVIGVVAGSLASVMSPSSCQVSIFAKSSTIMCLGFLYCANPICLLEWLVGFMIWLGIASLPVLSIVWVLVVIAQRMFPKSA